MAEACVLITVYNGAPWIDEALDSALAQRDVEIEVLVVDDGSTDETPTILERRRLRSPERIRVVRIPQSGLSRARNVGLDHAEAEFVTCLDADDRMHPLRVRMEVEALRAHPDAVLSFSARWNFVDGEDEGEYGFLPTAFGADGDELFRRLEDPISAMLDAGEYPGTDACTVRTEWARAHGQFDESIRSFVDGERWIRTLPAHAAVYVAAPLYQRRVHPASMSASSVDGSQVLFRVMDDARGRWSSYTSRQQRNLAAFEKRAGVWFARRAGLAGRHDEGRAFLLAHRRRLMGAFWWRTMLFLLTPLAVHRAWRSLKGSPGDASRAKVPLADVMVEDPASVWGRRTHVRSAEVAKR